jgi:hypothetical protein
MRSVAKHPKHHESKKNRATRHNSGECADVDANADASAAVADHASAIPDTGTHRNGKGCGGGGSCGSSGSDGSNVGSSIGTGIGIGTDGTSGTGGGVGEHGRKHVGGAEECEGHGDTAAGVGHDCQHEYCETESGRWVKVVRAMICDLEFGEVQLSVHRGRVVEIRKLEKIRFDTDK